MTPWSLFLLSLAPRITYLAVEHRQIYHSFLGNLYEGISYDLAYFQTFTFRNVPTTGIEPLYPSFLAVFTALCDNLYLTIGLQAAVVSLAPPLIYRLCLELGLTRRAAMMAGALYALHPYLIRHSTLMSEVTFYSLLLIVSCFCFVKCERRGRKETFFCGTAFGLLLLSRASSLPIVVAALAALFWRKRWKQALIIGCLCFGMTFPFALRNYHLERVWTPSRSGINLFEGNCEYTAAVLPKYSTDLLNAYAFARLQKERPEILSPTDTGENLFYTKGAADDFFTEKAVEYIRAHPWQTLAQRAKNVFYLFYPRLVPRFSVNHKSNLNLFPDGSVTAQNVPPRELFSEILYSTYYGTILVGALAGLWLRRSKLLRGDFILIATAVSFAVVYSIYWPATRLRAPMDFVLIFYAACAFSRLAGRGRPE